MITADTYIILCGARGRVGVVVGAPGDVDGDDVGCLRGNRLKLTVYVASVIYVQETHQEMRDPNVTLDVHS